MRNKELIQEIYEICMTADYRDEGHVISECILNLIDKEAPALVAYTLEDDWENPKMPTYE